MSNFRSADDTRPYSEVRAERGDEFDQLRRWHEEVVRRRRNTALAEAERLERKALATADPAEARRLQLEAENLRAALTDGGEV